LNLFWKISMPLHLKSNFWYDNCFYFIKVGAF